MRLIDADNLYYKVKCECNPYGKPTIDFESGMKVLDWIEKAQTVEERKRGEWVEQPNDHNHFMCSECGKPCDMVLTVSGYIVEQLSDFCPDCGADMRGERK